MGWESKSAAGVFEDLYPGRRGGVTGAAATCDPSVTSEHRLLQLLADTAGKAAQEDSEAWAPAAYKALT